MLFINNKYTRWYYAIVTAAQIQARPNQYTERHHIIPRSLGGGNERENLVRLTAREHFVCHRLLTKMLLKPDVFKMQHALWRFCHSTNSPNGYNIKSWQLEKLKLAQAEAASAALTGVRRSEETKKKMRKPKSLEARRNMSVAQKGLKVGRPAHNKGKPSPLKGVPKSNETKEKMRKPKPKTQCPQCGKVGGHCAMIRWHFDNCRSKDL